MAMSPGRRLAYTVIGVCAFVVLTLVLLGTSGMAKRRAVTNLYLPGTEGFRKTEFIRDVVPKSMRIVLTHEGHPETFGTGLDHDAVKKAGISEDSLKRLQAVSLGKQTYQRVAMHVVVDRGLPENNPEPTLCGVFIRTPAIEMGPWMLNLTHEAVHCRISLLHADKAYIKAVMPAVRLESTMLPGIKYGYFEEVVVTGVLMAMRERPDIAARARNKTIRSVARGVNYEGSIGYHTQQRLLQLCPTMNDCSSDPTTMAGIMTSDAEMLKAIETDFKWFETHDLSVQHKTVAQKD